PFIFDLYSLSLHDALPILELVWIVDFLTRLTTGVQFLGLAEYMFRADNPLFVRGLSLFHVALPFLLLWLVYRLGYNWHAWIAQTDRKSTRLNSSHVSISYA